jgi:hypothetical protein
VEFLARYRKDSKAFDHHEIAEFVREDGRWYLQGREGAAAGAGRSAGPENRKERSMPLWQRQKVQKMLREVSGG